MVSVHRHLAVLRGELRSDEAERTWAAARRLPERHQGALLLAPTRLLWCGLGVFGQSLEAFPLGVLGAAEVRGARRRAELRFAVPGAEERFAGRRADLERLADAIVDGRPLAAADGQHEPTLIDELERLERLLRSGSLSRAEFERAKSRLLG